MNALLQARFPLIIAANSGRNPKTAKLLAELSSLLAIGVCTSCQSAVCIPWTHPNYIGSSFRGKNDLLDQADVVILLEVDIPWIESKPLDDARVFVIDNDPLKTTFQWSHVDADLICKADPEVALTQLITALDSPEFKALTADALPARQARLRGLRSAWIDGLAADEQVKSLAPDGIALAVPYVLGTLRDVVCAQTPSKGEKVLWVNEAISSYHLAWTHLKPEHPGSMIASGGTSLGYSLGASIGAYLGGIVAEKGYELIATVVGDGTYLFGIPASAYWIARRYNTVSALDRAVVVSSVQST